MARAQITKTVAAKRLIIAAIQMLFRNEDSLAVHTVAMAAFRILHDLAKHRGLKHPLDSMIRPGMERRFWGEFRNAANFLKHADRDPDETMTSFSDEANDSLLVIACTYYESLGNQCTTEMQLLIYWYLSLHPGALSKDVNPTVIAQLGLSGDARSLPRSEQLEIGLTVLRRL